MTSKPLTNRQQQTLELIKSFIAQKGYAPSVTEVAELLQLKSRSTAHSLVKQLVDKGFLMKTDKGVRTLRVVGEEEVSVQVYKTLLEDNARLLQENAELREKLAGYANR